MLIPVFEKLFNVRSPVDVDVKVDGEGDVEDEAANAATTAAAVVSYWLIWTSK